MNTDLLTPKQVAQQYPLSLSLIYLLCEQHQLAHTRVGGRGRRGRLLIAPADVEAYLLNNRVEADAGLNRGRSPS
jgi:hypothetical protein